MHQVHQLSKKQRNVKPIFVFERYEYLGEAGPDWLSPDSATPEWVRALEKGSELRVNEMPGSNAVIRFRKSPGSE